MGVQGQFRIARYSLVSRQEWARFPVLWLEETLGLFQYPLNKKKKKFSPGTIRILPKKVIASDGQYLKHEK